MNLTQKKCKPCEGNTPTLTEEQAKELLKQIPGWEIKNDHLYRQFKFKKFRESVAFVNKIAEIAEQEGHHPDIIINYNKVSIELWTHAINGISENDFILATKINNI
ncbi:4a-hydroxytetrahydrobiopterin dehydratase [Candidatus Woesearchaeota archaeon]|nr:4a-hydroxytetrahydrobiopterin dehydratase [Candidatus Woesearchaeota archaeon]